VTLTVMILRAAVLCGYAIVLTGLAAWRLRHRDA
jgi:hypothetical protein